MAKRKSARSVSGPARGASKRSKGASKSDAKSAAKPGGKVAAKAESRLDDIRTRINLLDKKMIDVMNERAELVVEVGKLKRTLGLPIYTPHREVEVIDRAIKYSGGPLPEKTIESVFRELMSGSFALQQPMRIGYLGPAGSYSHAAAVRHFGGSVEFEDLREISGVFTEVQRGHVNHGLVPIENSTGGGIVETLDAFRDAKGHVSIYAEVQLAVHHALLANCAPKDVKRIYSKAEAFGQCRRWLATQYPHAELIPSTSTSRAAQTAAEECATAVRIGATPASGAVGSALAGQIYGLNVLFPRIEDNPHNITRFFVISRHKAQKSGDDKTSIMFNTADKPGALVRVLQVFERAGVNLTHIDKRPSGRNNWQYTFFVDAQGHRDDPSVAGAIKEVATHCEHMSVLGSYPRSKRIL